ncbi:RNA polymerase sigma-54 factor, partial [Neorhizobium galegae]
MGLSANLFLRQTQSLVMTPQLMQSIQLLQMTHFELNQFIAQEVEKNPLLEITSSESENDAETGFETADDFAPIEDRESSAAAEVDSDWYEGSSSISAERLGEGLDTGFENVFPDDGPVRRADAPELLSQWKSMPGGESGEDYDLDDFVAGQVTLRDHLNQQIPFLIVDAAGRLIAQHLVDQLDEAGYMLGDIEEIAARLGRSSENVEAILHSLQTLDPPGVFARSLSECLAIQLREK